MGENESNIVKCCSSFREARQNHIHTKQVETDIKHLRPLHAPAQCVCLTIHFLGWGWKCQDCLSNNVFNWMVRIQLSTNQGVQVNHIAGLEENQRNLHQHLVWGCSLCLVSAHLTARNPSKILFTTSRFKPSHPPFLESLLVNTEVCGQDWGQEPPNTAPKIHKTPLVDSVCLPKKPHVPTNGGHRRKTVPRPHQALHGAETLPVEDLHRS